MKVVVNKCFGGFGLSSLATKRLAELNGRECYFFKQDYPSKKYDPVALEDVKGLFYHAFDVKDPNQLKDINKHFIYYSGIDRDDPKLIQVIEELGEKANGDYAKLKIVEIPDGVDYEIDDYDGQESIHERHRSW